MSANPHKSPRSGTSPGPEQTKVRPTPGGLHANPPAPGHTGRKPDRKPAAPAPACGTAEQMCPRPQEPLPLAALIGELEGREANPGDLFRIGESLRNDCEVIMPGDRLLDIKVAHGRMYCTALSETQSATHNSGCLRLIVAGINFDDSLVWETVVRLPLSAPDSQGLLMLAEEAADSGVTPVAGWLARFHGLSRKGHESAMVGIFKATNPPIK